MGAYDDLIVQEVALQTKLARMLFLASKPKRRSDFVGMIHTSEFIDPAVAVPLDDRAPSAGSVLRQMKALGADRDCYALSLSKALDGKVLSLDEALAATVGFTVETVLFCLHSRVGYYEGGHGNDRCILLGRSRA